MEISKLLVANRGEIAVRIFRTARELGIATVAVAAPDDRGALHERAADEAVEIASYLASEEHVRAAGQTGADAIHPGYGFLAENADFAEAVEAAGLVFVGPSPEALRAGGDKLEAKRIAREAGVPVVPQGEPGELGYPLVIKAAAGGGGRGMRVVRAPEELEDALDAARREAKAAFGDDRVFCERYVERPRHVEIQLLADAHGAVVALGERECSIQRRHQKVLEESPSPALDAALRAEMSEAAVAFACAIGYRSAGTAEFMLDGRDFWFLELNGRIQVEHPVTEAVTGVDLVAEQLRVARGEPLDASNSLLLAPNSAPSAGLGASNSLLQGHAVEVRLYAEDPRTFLPQAGRIERLRLPQTIRVDAGVEEGDEVGVGYDPMIAKLIAHGETRDEALAHLRAALAETEVAGLTTNLPFLRWLVAHPAVRDGDTTTAFLEDYPPLSAPPRFPDPVWREPWRLNLPAPPRRPPPDLESAAHAHGPTTEESALTAPMPGTVIKVLAAPGDRVEPRQTLLVLEAMKMETPIVSPYEAVVKAVHVAEGDRVAGNQLLVELEE
jgi:acetyl/propionyl-CoA carboxylase alpha subunit